VCYIIVKGNTKPQFNKEAAKMTAVANIVAVVGIVAIAVYLPAFVYVLIKYPLK
jgi:hypothetical protein